MRASVRMLTCFTGIRRDSLYNTEMYYRLPVLFLVVRFVGSAEIVDPPRDVTARLGDNTRLVCGVEGDVTSDPFNWLEFQTGKAGSAIYKNPGSIGSNNPYNRNSTKYTIVGTYHLIIHDANFGDAGSYACDVFSQNSPSAASLVVLGSPKLSFDKRPLVEGEQTSVQCTADYAAPSSLQPDHIPYLLILMGAQSVLSGVQRNRDTGVTKVSLSQTVNITWKADHSDRVMRCLILTDDPGFSYSTEAKINILYPARNVRYSPALVSYSVGDVIRCDASGNPPPTYVWQDLSGDRDRIVGQSFKVDQDMIGKDNRWECVAVNTINETTVSDELTIHFEVVARPNTESPENSSASTRDTGSVVLLTVPLLVTSLLVFASDCLR